MHRQVQPQVSLHFIKSWGGASEPPRVPWHRHCVNNRHPPRTIRHQTKYMPPAHAILLDNAAKFVAGSAVAGIAVAAFWNSFLDKTVETPLEFQTAGAKESER